MISSALNICGVVSGGIFADGEYTHACRLRASSTRSSRSMRTQFAPRSWSVFFSLFGREVGSRPRLLRPNQKKEGPHKGVLLFLVEAAGLEPTVSSTRNWRDTTFATPRNMRFLISARCRGFPSRDYYITSFRLCQSQNQIKKVFFALYEYISLLNTTIDGRIIVQPTR